MNTLKHVLPALLVMAVMGFASNASAALVSKLGGAVVYDKDRDITWLADANLAASYTFNVNGINDDGYMNWLTAQNWVAAMNAANYLGYHDWRLPTAQNPDGGFCAHANCSGGELGHLFYEELGGVLGTSILTTHNANFNLFSNFQSYTYWSSSSNMVDGTFVVYYFDYSNGYQGATLQSEFSNGLAVRSGDVAAVPLPAAVWLFGSALTGLVALGRRNRRHV